MALTFEGRASRKEQEDEESFLREGRANLAATRRLLASSSTLGGPESVRVCGASEGTLEEAYVALLQRAKAGFIAVPENSWWKFERLMCRGKKAD